MNYLVEAGYSPSMMTSETYPSVPGAGDRRTVTYTPDAAGRLASLNSNATTYAPAASVSSIGYASSNALNTETYGNSLVHAVTYNNRLQPTEIKLGTSSNPTSILSLAYNYGTTNNNGNVLGVTYNGGGLSYTQSFGYDQLNRLTTSNENGGSSWSETNGYDRYGNRWIDLGGGNQSLYFNTANNRISGWSYDNAGNLLNDGVHAYTYDAENKIKTVDSATAYIYDAEGQRVKKLVGENTRFIYGIGGQLIAEFDGATGNLKKEYLHGGATLITIEPSAVNSNGTQYTTSDSLGSPRVITKAGGLVASRHDYQPFGTELGAGVGGRTTGMGFSNGGDTNRKKFTGYERDTETGLDFAQARYFSSSQGRFTSPDPLASSAKATDPQSWNRYSYVGNNPMVFSDPSGMVRQPGGRNISNWNGAMASEQATEGISPWPETDASASNAVGEHEASGSGAGAETHGDPQAVLDIEPPTDPHEYAVAGALMGEIYSLGQAIYAPGDYTKEVKNGKNVLPKPMGELTYAHILAEAYLMVSAINVRARDKGISWTDVVNEKQTNGNFQIEGNHKGPGYLSLVKTDLQMHLRLKAIKWAIGEVKRTGGSDKFNYWKGVVQQGKDGPFVRKINGVGNSTPGAVRVGGTDFYWAPYK